MACRKRVGTKMKFVRDSLAGPKATPGAGPRSNDFAVKT